MALPHPPSGVSSEVTDAAKMRRLVQAVQDLSRARDVAAVAAIVRRAARSLTGADGATFVLLEDDQCHYVDEEAIEPLWKGRRFPKEACVSGWAMMHGRSVVIPDIYQDPRVPHDAYRPTFVKSLALVPIRPNDPLGAIGNYWARNHEPNAQDVEVLQALANTTAVALETIRLHESLEARVRQRTAELQAANRELEAFTQAVSHDVRAPMRIIQSYSQLALRQDGLPAPASELVAEIGKRAKSLTALLESLLEMYRVVQGGLVREQVPMRDLAMLAATEARRDQNLPEAEVVVQEDLPECHADPALMRQVLQNLIGNALKFSRGRAHPRVEVTGTREGPTASYCVKDNGVGFDIAAAQALFQPFRSLHDRREYPGSGIGLSIVQRVVERHGGRVWAEASPGQGAAFRFTIPS